MRSWEGARKRGGAASMEHRVRIAERKLAPAEGLAAGLATDSTGGDDEEQRGRPPRLLSPKHTLTSSWIVQGGRVAA